MVVTDRVTNPDLFEHVMQTYGDVSEGVITNDRLYEAVAHRAGISAAALDEKEPVGESGQRHSLLKRQIRWHQQTLKRLGVIERVDGLRGVWQVTSEGKQKLRRAEDDTALVAFSTDLGIAIFASCQRVFPRLGEPIHLIITSPPYPLRKPRDYGNPTQEQYVDFICHALEPLVSNLCPGGSICINVGCEVFQPGLPSRSTYVERLVIALEDRLGLSLMDRLVWSNPSKPPSPIQWASKSRCQLNAGYEPVYWFTNDPRAVQSRADNRRVLQPHTERHLRLMASGGERRTASYANGAHKVREGSYGNSTPGRIPRNVLTIGHSCQDHREYRRDAAELGLPVHGAPMPLSLPEFLIRFLSSPGELVADPFGGKGTTARAAENHGRRWIVTEWILEYLRGAAQRFDSSPGYWLNPAIQSLTAL